MKKITLEQKWDEKYTLVKYTTNYGLFEDGDYLHMVNKEEIENAIKNGFYELYGAKLKITKIE